MKREDRRWVPALAGLALTPSIPRVAPARTRSRLDAGWRGPHEVLRGTSRLLYDLFNSGSLHDVPIEMATGIGIWIDIEPVVSPICLNFVPHRSRPVIVLKNEVGS